MKKRVSVGGCVCECVNACESVQVDASFPVRGRHVCDRCVGGDVCIYMSECPCGGVRT